jgi:hypothetical protein
LRSSEEVADFPMCHAPDYGVRRDFPMP